MSLVTKKSKAVIAALLLTLAGITTQAISKIGGKSIISPNNGFEIIRPIKLFQTQQLTEDRIRFIGMQLMTGTGLQPQMMELDAFANVYPSLAGMDRPPTHEYFLSKEWKPTAAASTCAEAFVKSSDTALAYVSAWGEGRGIYIIVTNTVDGTSSLKEMISSLHIDENLCGWKKWKSKT